MKPTDELGCRNKKFCILMEFLPQSLRQATDIKAQNKDYFSFEQIMDITVTTANVLKFLEENHIAHCNIQASSIFVSDDWVFRLSEFQEAINTIGTQAFSLLSADIFKWEQRTYQNKMRDSGGGKALPQLSSRGIADVRARTRSNIFIRRTKCARESLPSYYSSLPPLK